MLKIKQERGITNGFLTLRNQKRLGFNVCCMKASFFSVKQKEVHSPRAGKGTELRKFRCASHLDIIGEEPIWDNTGFQDRVPSRGENVCSCITDHPSCMNFSSKTHQFGFKSREKKMARKSGTDEGQRIYLENTGASRVCLSWKRQCYPRR